MRHGMSGRKLGRTKSHRKALFANMATSLLKHGQIRTTLPKAKDLRKIVEPLITLAKKGDLHARRLAASTITEAEVVKHLFDNIGPAAAKRQGGYTRVIKAGFRLGDAAPMAIIELTDKPEKAFGSEEAPATKKTSEKKASSKKTAETSTAKATETKKAAPKKEAAAKPAATAKKATSKTTTTKKTATKKDAK